MADGMRRRGDGSDAPPCAALLADVVEALESGRLPSEVAIEEVAFLLRGRGLVEAELRRRAGLAAVRELRAAYPLLSLAEAARLAARRVGAPAETIRWWWRSAESTSAPWDAGSQGGST